MAHPVVTALLPVVLLVTIGWLAGRLQWIRPASVKDLANLVFLVLSPALLFRTMSTVRTEQLALGPLASYFTACVLLYLGILAVQGWNRAGAVLALAATFSNTFMIGVPLVGLAFGDAGLAQLFPLISLHALVLLSLATVALELAVVREHPGGFHGRTLARTLFTAVRHAVIHPVPLPILAGLAFGQTGWTLPRAVDQPLQLLGQAMGPMALLMVGVTLAQIRIGAHWRGALAIALLKTVAHPLLMLGVGLAVGLSGLPFAVMLLAASLPIGANVFLFSQRYGVVEDQVTAAVALSTLTALVSLSVVLAVLGGRA